MTGGPVRRDVTDTELPFAERVAAIAAGLHKLEGSHKEGCVDGTTTRNRRRRALFAEYTRLHADCEAEDDSQGLKHIVQVLRPRFGLEAVPPSPLLLSVPRMVLLYTVIIIGCTNLILAVPLRWAHPLLRRLGVQNGRLPMDFLSRVWAHCLLAACGVALTVEGKERDQRWRAPHQSVRSGIVVYNHTSNLDGICVQVGVSQMSPKYIMKKVLFMVPFLGWVCQALGMIALDRGNRDKAVTALNTAVKVVMQRWRRSVAVSPEGTRSTDGSLVLPFKKGPFHMQINTEAPLLPLVLFGAYELWPPGRRFPSSGRVTLRVLDAIPYDPDRPRCETRRLLQTTFADSLADGPPIGVVPLTWRERGWELGVIVFIVAWARFQLIIFTAVVGYFELGVLGVGVLLALASVILAAAAAVVY